MTNDNLPNNDDAVNRLPITNGLVGVALIAALFFALQTTVLALLLLRDPAGKGALNNPQNSACLQRGQRNPKLDERDLWDCEPAPVRINAPATTIERV